MEVPPCPGCRERDERIAGLLRERDERVAALEARVGELEAIIAALSRPPAPPRSPAPQAPAPAKKPTGRPPGGQPGHPPHLKQVLPPERVHHTVPYVPAACDHCRAPLPAEAGPDDPPPLRYQVAELPELAARITEHQAHARTCPCCGRLTRATIPAEVRAHSVGPRLTAVLSYLVGCHGVSKRGVEEIAQAVFEAPVALGTVANLEQEVSAALAPAHAQALAAVQQAPVKYVDETGWKEAGRKRWLWLAATGAVAVFIIHVLRNVAALRRLVGATVTGVLCSDRWSAYDHVALRQRQVCWAHLKRNWETLAERGGKAKAVAEACLAVQRRVFELWHLFRGGGCSRVQLDRRLYEPMIELLEVLRRGARCREPKTRRFCARLLTVYPSLWTFVIQEGVEPTNNHAERLLRRAVVWRRRSFGCRSAAGCRFAERILTAVQTLRLQGRSVVQFLQETVAAHRSGRAGPPLVLEG
jgi:transposase